MESVIQLTINKSTKKGVIKDMTDYEALGFTPELLSSYGAKGLGVIKCNGTIIVSKMDINDPLIDLSDGDTEFMFDLVLDSGGDVANATYSIEYYVNMSKTGINYSGTDVPTKVEVSAVDGLSNFLEEGNVLSFALSPSGTEELTIVSVEDIGGGDVIIELNTAPTQSGGSFSFNITNQTFLKSWVYKGCKEVKPCIEFTSDCDYGTNGVFIVDKDVKLDGATITGTNCKISYPSWTALENPSFNPDITVNVLPYTNTTLATGTYTVDLTLQISKTESDGLIVTYVSSDSKEFFVSCMNSMCGMTACIEKLLSAHRQALKTSPVSPYQSTIDTVNTLSNLYRELKSCGKIDEARKALETIDIAIQSSGVECNCGCDNDELKWVQNTSPSTTAYIDQVKEMVAQQIWNGVPDANVDASIGMKVGFVLVDYNTGIEYICTNNTVGNAVWKIHPDTIYQATLTQISENNPNAINVDANFDLSAHPVTYSREGEGFYYVECDLFNANSKIHVQQGSQLGIVCAFVLAKGGGEYRGCIETFGSFTTHDDSILSRSAIRIEF